MAVGGEPLSHSYQPCSLLGLFSANQAAASLGSRRAGDPCCQSSIGVARRIPSRGTRHSGGFKLRADLRQQRGRGLTLQVSLAALDKILQEATPLLSAGFSDAQDSLDDPTAPLTIRPAAALPPQDGVAQRSLGGVIRRLDGLMPHEGPQLPLVSEQFTACPRRLRATTGRSFRQCRTDLSPKAADVDLETGPAQRTVSHPMPPGEDPLRQVQQLLPDGRAAVLAVDHRLKIPTQMRPTELAAAEPVVRLPAIRGNDVAVGR